MTITETDSPGVVGFGIDGRPSAIELNALVNYFEELLRQNRTLRVLGRLKLSMAWRLAESCTERSST